MLCLQLKSNAKEPFEKFDCCPVVKNVRICSSQVFARINEKHYYVILKIIPYLMCLIMRTQCF